MNRRLWLLLAMLVCAYGLSTCTKELPPFDQPDRASAIGLPPPPTTIEEWRSHVTALDNARAENQRKDAEIKAAIDAKNQANAETWKRFGLYSFMFMIPGVGLLIGSFFVPALAAARSAAMVLIGLGFICGLMPHLIATYGPLAFIPAAVACGLWVLTVAGVDIYGRIRKARAEAKVAANALDPEKPEVAAPNLISTKVENDPVFAAALTKEVGAEVVAALPAPVIGVT